ncbi:hypothetical protein SETIT_5G036400v2 [Setaria italica]|uniref:AAA+ ATPase domain-containing protein n=1 Tax=Setaria italica TaxID=4555 RepID=K3XE98_SETIT|nr:putative disease resistance RPP13-like protein 3 [Setaria italica]RCV23832.1 hypothetical protein SETIT_5G036400v2 [Setaria italica]
MELAAGAVSPLLRKLGELLVGELTLEQRVRKDVVSLKTEMEWMDEALRKVAKVDQPDEQDTHWAREVRELSYDMEDAVDAFMLRVTGDTEPARGDLKCRVQEFLKKTGRLFGKGKELHQIAGAVEDAKRLSNQLRECSQKYKIWPEVKDGGGTGSGTGGDSIDPRLTAMFREVTELVGVNGSRDELIERISDRSKKHAQTVSIVGFGGLGKTTLAKAVYDTVKDQFVCAAFVSVSRSPDFTRIFKKILFQLDKEQYAHFDEAVWDAMQLINELKGFLQNKRFLIVIDDIWDAEAWDFIKNAFPKNYLGSALITTTRKHDVAKACCPSTDDHNKIYKMMTLSESDSQRLFYMRIFGHRNGCSPELEQVSTDILKKCGGVPLAIISIASLLASHQQIKAKDQWYTVLNSIGHGLGDNVKNMREILSYSYYDLPFHLKACLLYLSIFSEDHDIGRDRLIWRWIAEGFVQHENNNDNLYEVGESYFNELINRSMVEPVGIDFEGRAQSCRVHDIVLDLIRSLSTKENFVTIWDDTETTSSKFKVRRLSLQNSSAPGSATTTLLQVRSFTAFSPAVDSMPSLSQFQVLRVLDLEGCALKKCGDHFNLKHVGNLSQLRYLGLRRTYIHELPVEIGKLQFLQTLDIRGAHGIQKLPQTISRLRKLMCLHLDWDTKLPKGLSNLTSLEELTGLRIGQDSAHIVREELSHLTGLRVLKMSWEKDTDLGEDLVKSLGNLREIQSLDVYVNGGRGDLIRTWASPPGLRRFLSRGPTSELSTLPAWVSSSSLTSLDVWVRRVRRDDLQALGALPALRGLRLRAAGRFNDDRGTERLPAVRAGAFPCVRACAFLHFVTAPSMFPGGAMPVARQLEFSVRAWDLAGGSGGLIGLDDLRMEHLPSLEEIKVDLWYSGGGDQVEIVAAVLRRAADGHPNHPTLRITATPCYRY